MTKHKSRRLIDTVLLTVLILFAARLFSLSTASAETGQPGLAEFEISKDATHPHRPYHVRGRILISAPRERVWDILVDCDAMERIVPQVRDCSVEAHGDGWDVRRHDLQSGAFRATSILRSDYSYPETVALRRVGGDMKVHSGVWTLESLPGGKTELRYEAWSKPKFWVPDWFIKRMLRKDVPSVLANLRTMAETEA